MSTRRAHRPDDPTGTPNRSGAQQLRKSGWLLIAEPVRNRDNPLTVCGHLLIVHSFEIRDYRKLRVEAAQRVKARDLSTRKDMVETWRQLYLGVTFLDLKTEETLLIE